MARSIRFALLLAVPVIAWLALSACSSLEQVSAAEFERALERGDQAETVHAYSPIGVTAQRAYIEHWSLLPILGERTSVLWTPVAGLRPEVLAKLRASR
ncbi:MAG TPA: hypothetical protein VK843_04350 [Planctomycetota bacterium]|nr:hypothetical protein [Planctomycetota bacterium]